MCTFKVPKMDPLGTNTHLLKRYRPSDSFCTFISESVWNHITNPAALKTGLNDAVITYFTVD